MIPPSLFLLIRLKVLELLSPDLVEVVEPAGGRHSVCSQPGMKHCVVGL